MFQKESKNYPLKKPTQTKTNSKPKSPEYAYRKGTSFAKEKEEKEILCPEVVSQEPVSKQKKYTISNNQSHLLTTNTLTVRKLNSIMGREVL